MPYNETGVKKVMSDEEMDENGAKAQKDDDKVLDHLVVEKLKVSEDICHEYELYNHEIIIPIKI